ncbi:hypothetical protein PAXRUDRAFT_355887 [Paxillus rubicundulus Ve08.2h10]|uniref:Uncharacterized protein n=1 Tax=Paxillus rubicundulus Ve08.2h10 TaxID=930991 RepID=A0A0D0DZA2_9AGAM|nr:hypothetical protein PAXRUDRAFT_355887 [Paxillus rubicundulus Ve08.2h10]
MTALTYREERLGPQRSSGYRCSWGHQPRKRYQEDHTRNWGGASLHDNLTTIGRIWIIKFTQPPETPKQFEQVFAVNVRGGIPVLHSTLLSIRLRGDGESRGYLRYRPIRGPSQPMGYANWTVILHQSYTPQPWTSTSRHHGGLLCTSTFDSPQYAEAKVGENCAERCQRPASTPPKINYRAVGQKTTSILSYLAPYEVNLSLLVLKWLLRPDSRTTRHFLSSHEVLALRCIFPRKRGRPSDSPVDICISLPDLSSVGVATVTGST